jgi:DNA-binding MarR family transcriptional regulator
MEREHAATTVNLLERSVGFMMGVTYRKLSNLLQHRLKEYDITPEQWSVLYQVDRAEGLIQKEIAERTCKDKPTTTRILDHLESKGLIYKQTGKNDRRSFLVYATDKGSSLIGQTAPVEQQLIEEIKMCVTEEEYALLMELIIRINHRAAELTDQE